MKKVLIVASVLIVLVLSSCKKESVLPKDDIYYTEINKTVTKGGADSIPAVLGYYVFQIDTTSALHQQVVMFKSFDELVLCDAFDELAVWGNNVAHLFTMNESIFSDATWSENAVYLDGFAGKGEQYIGYRVNSFPGGEYEYYYGWIKIKLSEDKNTLQIIGKAGNHTEGNPIKAGQRE